MSYQGIQPAHHLVSSEDVSKSKLIAYMLIETKFSFYLPFLYTSGY